MASTTKAKAEQITAAWTEYRTAAAKLSSDRSVGWSDYLDADGRLFARYLAAERSILAQPEPKAA